MLLEHQVETGDIFRMCQTKDAPIRDWVKLAVTRARATGTPAVFWLNAATRPRRRAHQEGRAYLPEHDTERPGAAHHDPVDAMRFSLERIRRGEDTIAVTGNVLRDYLTDLFPILELGTSARMLSIVPLMNGGGLFETGAGGSAPKHVQQFERRATCAGTRWASTAPWSRRWSHAYLENGRLPSRKAHELDNRGSTFYLAMYWAQALAAQTKDPELAARFAPVAEALAAKEEAIINELLVVQGWPVDLGGYYMPDDAKTEAAMRPSETFNAIIDPLR
jgi:isocitrate dehydrogenase